MPSTHLNKTTNPLQLLMASMPKKGSGADPEDLNGAEFSDLLTPLKADKDGLAANTSAATTGRSSDHSHMAEGFPGKAIVTDPSAVGGGPVRYSGTNTVTDDDLTVLAGKPHLDGQRLSQKSTPTIATDNAGTYLSGRLSATALSASALPGDPAQAGIKTGPDASRVATAVTGPAGHTEPAESRTPGSNLNQAPATSPRVTGETPAGLPIANQAATSVQKGAIVPSAQATTRVAGDSEPTAQQSVPSGSVGTVQRQSGETIVATAPARNQAATGSTVQAAGIKANTTAHKATPATSSTSQSAPGQPSTGTLAKAIDGNRASADPVAAKEATSRVNRPNGRVPTQTGASSTRRAEVEVVSTAGRGADTNLLATPAAGTGMQAATASPTATVAAPVAPPSLAPASVEPVNLEPIDASLGEPEFTDQLFERLSVMLRGPLGQASIRINPEELGPIRVELNVDGQQASLRFTAAHAETRAALDASMNDLREQFSQEGLELQDAQVDDEHGGTEDQPDADEQRRPGYAAGQSDQGTSSALNSGTSDDASRVSGDTTVRPPTDGRIDLIA